MSSKCLDIAFPHALDISKYVEMELVERVEPASKGLHACLWEFKRFIKVYFTIVLYVIEITKSDIRVVHVASDHHLKQSTIPWAT